MAKIVLDNVVSGYDLSKININFQRIATELNDKVLYRVNPGTETNTMSSNLDMNGMRIFNLHDPTLDGEPVTLGYLNNLPDAAASSAVEAAISAAEALASANAAADSKALIADWMYKNTWTTATEYKKNNIVTGTGSYQGWSLIALVDHTSTGTTTDTDAGTGKWGILAARGPTGSGTGDMLAANNLSDLVDKATSRFNLGVATSPTGSNITSAGTTAQRDGSPLPGYFRFNSDVSKFEGYNGIAWGSIGGGATGGGSDEIFVQNKRIMTTSYTLPANTSASMVGPLVIGTGLSVTIPTGERLVVL